MNLRSDRKGGVPTAIGVRCLSRCTPPGEPARRAAGATAAALTAGRTVGVGTRRTGWPRLPPPTARSGLTRWRMILVRAGTARAGGGASSFSTSVGALAIRGVGDATISRTVTRRVTRAGVALGAGAATRSTEVAFGVSGVDRAGGEPSADGLGTGAMPCATRTGCVGACWVVGASAIPASGTSACIASPCVAPLDFA